MRQRPWWSQNGRGPCPQNGVGLTGHEAADTPAHNWEGASVASSSGRPNTRTVGGGGQRGGGPCPTRARALVHKTVEAPLQRQHTPQWSQGSKTLIPNAIGTPLIPMKGRHPSPIRGSPGDPKAAQALAQTCGVLGGSTEAEVPAPKRRKAPAPMRGRSLGGPGTAPKYERLAASSPVVLKRRTPPHQNSEALLVAKWRTPPLSPAGALEIPKWRRPH